MARSAGTPGRASVPPSIAAEPRQALMSRMQLGGRERRRTTGPAHTGCAAVLCVICRGRQRCGALPPPSQGRSPGILSAAADAFPMGYPHAHGRRPRRTPRSAQRPPSVGLAKSSGLLLPAYRPHAGAYWVPAFETVLAQVSAALIGWVIHFVVGPGYSSAGISMVIAIRLAHGHGGCGAPVGGLHRHELRAACRGDE